MAREKIINAHKAGVDCISTLCPFCFVALDIGQVQIRGKFQESYDMPIIHYSELLALSLGVPPDELSLETRINSTVIYTHLVHFESDEYHTATSKSLKRDEELLASGFEYVTEREGFKIYRKRK